MEGVTTELSSLLRRALGPTVAEQRTGPIAVRAICADSRQVTLGALFVAVAGSRANGATFVADAVARGAVAVVTDTDLPGHPGQQVAPVSSRCAVIMVPDARLALAKLAAVFHGLAGIQDAGGMTAIGVTGTNGKSTVAYMVRSILRSAGRAAAMLGTIEYDLVGRTVRANLTTPDAVTLTQYLVEAHAAGARHAVMEVSSHSLEQRRTDGIRFAAALFTNLTQDHLDYHGTLDQYLLAKRRLFEGLTPEATAVVNAEDPASERLLAGCPARRIRYGVDQPADLRAQIVAQGRFGTRFTLEWDGRQVDVQMPLVGRHNVFNALAAAGGAIAVGVELEVVRRGLEALSCVPGRLQGVDTGDLGFDVYVDYAHTDDALRNVLRALRPLTRGRLWCVFGCGGDRDRTKRPLMARAVAEGADAFAITSDNPRTEDPLAIIADIKRGLTTEDLARGLIVADRAAAISRTIGLLTPGDTLLITGKGHEDCQIFGTEKVHFDDVEAAREAIGRRRAMVTCGR